MKLKQGQTWDCGNEFVRIVDLQRLEVGYKTFKSLGSSTGTHQRTSKKDFCRMLKSANLVTNGGRGQTVESVHRSLAPSKELAKGKGVTH